MILLATVRDAFSRRIVGWKTSDRCDTDLVTAALDYAAWSRDIRDGELIHHSDKGSTYTAVKFTDRLADNGIRPSTGSVGDSFDNALAENFFSTFKINRLSAEGDPWKGIARHARGLGAAIRRRDGR